MNSKPSLLSLLLLLCVGCGSPAVDREDGGSEADTSVDMGRADTSSSCASTECPYQDDCYDDGATHPMTGVIACGVDDSGVLKRVCLGGVWENIDECVGEVDCQDGEQRDGTASCGFNDRGVLRESCVDGSWEVSDECVDPDECEDGATQRGAVSCGTFSTGVFEQECTEGAWGDTDRCLDPTEVVQLADIAADGGDGWTSSVSVLHDGSLYFVGEDADHGEELWVTDGSLEGTELFADLIPGPTGSSPQWLVSTAGGMFIFADGRLWHTDGSAPPAEIARLNGRHHAGHEIVMYASESTPRHVYGTTDGTDRRDLVVLGSSGGLIDVEPAPAMGATFFIVETGSGSHYMMCFDGTLARTLNEIDPALVDSVEGVTHAGKFYFRNAPQGVSDAELWVSDCTADGTEVVPLGSRSAPDAFAALPGGFIFASDEVLRGREMTFSDGAVFQGLPEINPSGSSYPRIRFTTQNLVFFAARESNGAERTLWVTDGTSVGTRDLDTMFAGGLSLSFGGGEFAATDAGLFFNAVHPSAGPHLFRTDGSPTGTVRITQFDSLGTAPPTFAVANDRIVFAATTAGVGRELWITDGTEGGEQRLTDLNPGVGNFMVSDRFHVLGGAVVFQANDGTTGQEPWVLRY